MSLLDQWEVEARSFVTNEGIGDASSSEVFLAFRILTLIELVRKKDAYLSVLNRETHKIGVETLNSEWVQSLTLEALALTESLK